jgi:hypothetical protein
MFNFLNPIILFAAGAAVLLPLLIHIFNRQKVKTIPFSSLLFLRSLEKTRMRRVKIKEYLLLLIRSLIILLVVAAFARPAIRGGFATKVGAHAKTSIVLLLDNSYSMGFETKDGPVFELAKEKAKRILNQLKEGDEASLIEFSSHPQMATPHPTHDFKSLIEYLDEEAQLTAQKTNVSEAVNLAYEVLKDSKNLNQEIYLVTDMDRSSWSDSRLNIPPSDEQKTKLYLVDVSPSERRNLCIEEISFGPQLIEKGRPFQIKAKIANYTYQEVNSLLVGLYLDGKRVSQTDVDLQKDGKASLKFNPSVDQAGIHTGFFELTDDDLLIDNRRYFTFRIPERIPVLLMGERERDTHHLGLALNPLDAEDANKKVTQRSKSSLSGIDFNKFDVVILSNLSRLTDVQLANLERFVQKGGGLFVILGDNIDSDFYANRLIKEFFNLRLKTPFKSTTNTSGFFSLERIDTDHPIFQVYRDLDKDQLPLIKFFSIFELPQSQEVKTIVSFSLGRPALVEKSFGAGKALLLAASVDESRADLVVHPFFVPMINRAVEYLAADLSRLDENILVGSKVTRELPADLAGKEIELFDPQMKKTSLQPSFQTDKLIIKIDETSLPGIYDVRASTSSSRGEVVDRFAVNIDPQDSDPQKIETSDVKDKLEGVDFLFIDAGDDVGESILQSRYGKELWKTFLWIVFGLLALEMFLARSRRKDTVSGEES